MVPMPQLRCTWIYPTGIKKRSNIIVHSQTLFHIETFVRPSDFFEYETWGVLLPEELATNKIGLREEIVEAVLAKKICTTPPPNCLRWRCMKKHLFLFPCILQRICSNRSCVKFRGDQVPAA